MVTAVALPHTHQAVGVTSKAAVAVPTRTTAITISTRLRKAFAGADRGRGLRVESTPARGARCDGRRRILVLLVVGLGLQTGRVLDVFVPVVLVLVPVGLGLGLGLGVGLVDARLGHLGVGSGRKRAGI